MESCSTTCGSTDEVVGSEKQAPAACEDRESAPTHENGEQAADNMLLSHSHAHAQWRIIAEEFSSLLDTDFVDVVFKVRGNKFLAVHRALVASVFPSLREDLRTVKLPSLELRVAGLTWINFAGAAPATDVAMPSQVVPAVRPVTPDILYNVDNQDNLKELGVVDISNRSWGTWNIVRALFCHLYSRPVAIPRDELTVLRNAAASLGSMELARCCDDAVDPGTWLRKKEGDEWKSSRDVSGISAAGESDSQFSRRVSGDEFASEHTIAGKCTPERRPSTIQTEDNRGNEARARARVAWKPPGESSFRDDGSKGNEESGFGIRHVLSDLKRTIVESSRIISDKAFNSMYENVPGDRGILGEGINGPVRMATNKRTGREVAVKRISCVNLSEQRRQMLHSEVRIFLQVSHRNIVQLFEVYESEADQAVLLVMELCTGKELFASLAEQRYYNEFDAARACRQMLDAVTYLHSQNICHRDLKLENWLYENMGADAKLKLCDFGFGQIVEPSVKLTATLGSLYYVAPEVLEGSYGLPCDMWSMGVIVHMLLSGNPPFDGKTDGDVMNKIKQGRFGTHGKRWEGISETAKHFLHSLLRKDPYERLSASEAAQHAWLNMEGTSKRMPAGLLPNEASIDQGVIRDMWNFAQNNAITRAALGMLSNSGNSATSSFHGTEPDVVSLEQQFKRFDSRNTGKIDADEFIKVLKQSLQLSSTDATKIFERIAGNVIEGGQENRRKRQVNYVNFINLTKAKRIANNSAAICEAFRAFDKDGEGFITDDEIRGILAEDFKGDEETVKATLEKCDFNGEGLIDYASFAAVFSEELSKKALVGPNSPRAQAEPCDVMPKRQSNNSVTLESDEKSPSAQLHSANNDDKSLESCVREDASEAKKDAKGSQLQDGEITAVAPTTPRKASCVADLEDANDDENEEESDSEGEEQLVSVSETTSREIAPSELQVAKEGKSSAAKNKTFPQSFSLSLAGSSELDDVVTHDIKRIVSLPSDLYIIRQLPGFHKEILKAYYANAPVSNVCMGLIRGTSLYAKQSVAAKLATIIHTICGWYFIMPNPKYHKEVNDRKGLLSKETGKFRFVAWWIHPRFVPQVRRWFERMTVEGKEKDRQNRGRERPQTEKAFEKNDKGEPPKPEPLERDVSRKDKDKDIETGTRNADAGHCSGITDDQPSPKCVTASNKFSRNNTERALSPAQPRPTPTEHDGLNPKNVNFDLGTGVSESTKYPVGMGSPGDLEFSDVPKPENYLHTYRDLHTREHIVMLTQLYEGVNRFLRTLFDENFLASAQISAGCHYPVRTQYSTLHMQVRVNSGSVCRDDGRGVDVRNLIENLQGDRLRYYRDEETLRYQVTENVKVALLAAAKDFTKEHPEMEVLRQTAPLGYDLGSLTMPTIKDDGEDAEDKGDDVSKTEIGEYIINLQPLAGSPFSKFLNDKRALCAEQFQKDPSHLYPLHISVTGFFESNRIDIDCLLALMHETISEELSELREREAVTVKECISVNAGYVLWDIEAPAITSIAKSLCSRAKDRIGLNIRPKAVNHISLAMGRPEPEQRRQIQDLYISGSESVKSGTIFELVLSRRTFRGSFDKLDAEGPHNFKEIARIPCTTTAASPRGAKDT